LSSSKLLKVIAAADMNFCRLSMLHCILRPIVHPVFSCLAFTPVHCLEMAAWINNLLHCAAAELLKLRCFCFKLLCSILTESALLGRYGSHCHSYKCYSFNISYIASDILAFKLGIYKKA